MRAEGMSPGQSDVLLIHIPRACAAQLSLAAWMQGEVDGAALIGNAWSRPPREGAFVVA